jgi:hypothetical protein
MFPPLQWDKFHQKFWSWLKGKPFQRHVQFRVECDPMQYENKVEAIKTIHSLNHLGDISPKGVQKPS